MKNRWLLRFGLIASVCAAAGFVSAQQEARHARAVPFSGTWGVRILCPTAYDKSKASTATVNAENFDIGFLLSQIDQLTTI